LATDCPCWRAQCFFAVFSEHSLYLITKQNKVV
jgi:hypothetical protein